MCKSWNNVIDFVVSEKPVFIQCSHDNVTMISTKMFQDFLEPLTFTVSFVAEDDGSITGTVEELDLFENSASKDETLALLLEAMREYNVKDCYYGHLHGNSHKDAIEGEVGGINFHLISADYLDFKLVKIL